MRIDVIATAKDINPDETKGKIIVILDILRATSTITTAFIHGCNKIIPAYSPEDAKDLKKIFPDAFLGGEIEGEKIPHFDFGNSPLEYCSSAVNNKLIILATTNGTKAIINSRKSNLILIGSLLNISSLTKKLNKLNSDIIIACAGTQGTYSLEDTYVAGKIINLLSSKDIHLTDSCYGALSTYHYYRSKNKNPLYISRNGKALLKKNRRSDIEFCSQENICDLVPIYDFEDQAITLSSI